MIDRKRARYCHYAIMQQGALDNMQRKMDKLAVGYWCRSDPHFEYCISTRKILNRSYGPSTDYGTAKIKRADGRY